MINITQLKNEPIETIAKRAAKALNAKIQARNGNFCLLLSGGSALKVLPFIDTSNFSPNTIIGVLDERYSKQESVNNFSQILLSDFGQIAKKLCVRFIDSRIIADETSEELASRLDKEFKAIRVPIFATIGMGPDGHTSGIMPYPEDAEFFKNTFIDDSHYVSSYNAGSKNQYPQRITTTIPFLKKIDFAVGIVTGLSKADVLRDVLGTEKSIPELPAKIWKEMRDVEIFTDFSLE